MRNTLLVLAAACFIGGVLGCGSGSTGDGVKPENQAVLSDAAAIAQKAPTYDLLSPEDKAKFLKGFSSEQGARAAFNMIKNPPNAGIVQSHSGGK